MSRLCFVLAACATIAICGSTLAQTPALVPVGGARLDVLEAGSGGPTAVLVAGLGNPLDSWAKVWPQISTFTSVVAYSRGGLGRSSPVQAPITARASVEELHRLVAALHVPVPYVLVGKSYGGILVRLYTSLYPREVAGLVLVDGSHEQQVQRWGQVDSTYPAAFRAYFDSLLPTKTGAEAAELRETIRIQAAGAVEGMLPLPDIPMAVLTSMQVSPNPLYVNQTARGHEVWRAMHEEWAARSHNALHLVTTQSSHAFEDDAPELIVQGIRFVLDRIRGKP